jgi:uncharacterized phage protein gp47/JayE
MATQEQYVSQMMAQLRALDPSISGEPGTPERKIIETVAQAMAEAQTDIAITSAPFDIESKYGTDIDKLISLFGYGRQGGGKAKGYVTFSRDNSSDKDINIPAGVQLMGPKPTAGGYNVMFITSSSSVLAKGTTSVTAPIECATSGVDGNASAGSITSWVGTPVYGITKVTNEAPTYGGLDPENDNELKTRFKNTVFRNVSGTMDQFLALAISANNVSQANILGPVSTYKEKIQVPTSDDSSTGGSANYYTTAPSSNSNIAHFYDNLQSYILKDTTTGESFYSPDTDYQINYPPLNYGDSKKSITTTVATAPSNAVETSYNVDWSSGTHWTSAILGGTVTSGGSTYTVTAAGTNTATLLCTTAGTVAATTSLTITYNPQQPNVTFKIPSTVSARSVVPGETVIFEYSYISKASRNNYEKQVLNCIDVFIDGQKPSVANVSIPIPSKQFTSDASSPFYTDFYRRVGDSGISPSSGNYFTALFQQPVTDLPDSISVSYAVSDVQTTYTYYKNVHYWGVEDWTSNRGTTRARNGIEWSSTIKGQSGKEVYYTGPVISGVDKSKISSINVNQYTYDQNIQDVQASSQANKQVTTDILVHGAKVRYFKPDVSVAYNNGVDPTSINNLIKNNLDVYFKGIPFGSYIQLSDILQIIHNTPGVDNVDWTYNQSQSKSSDTISLPLISTKEPYYAFKLRETNKFGQPLARFVIETSDNATLKTYFTKSASNYLDASYYKNNSFAISYIAGATKNTSTIEKSILSLNNTTGSTGYTLTAWKDKTNLDNSNGLLVAIRGLLGSQVSTSSYSLKGPTTFPTYSTPLYITGTGLPFSSNGILDLTARFNIDSYITSDKDYNSDISLGDDEIARLPDVIINADGTTDISSAIKIRQKTQNTWGH